MEIELNYEEVVTPVKSVTLTLTPREFEILTRIVGKASSIDIAKLVDNLNTSEIYNMYGLMVKRLNKFT